MFSDDILLEYAAWFLLAFWLCCSWLVWAFLRVYYSDRRRREGDALWKDLLAIAGGPVSIFIAMWQNDD